MYIYIMILACPKFEDKSNCRSSIPHGLHGRLLSSAPVASVEVVPGKLFSAMTCSCCESSSTAW